MNAEQIEELFKTSDRLVGAVSTDFHRYLEVDWRDRLICIVGARGTGKTTMLRQRMKESFGIGSERAIYISLDDRTNGSRGGRGVAAKWLKVKDIPM